ncbi:MAG: hypothetical protein ACOH1R_06805 [Luteimonas sp.]
MRTEHWLPGLGLCGLLPLACVSAAGKTPVPPDPTAAPLMITAGFLSWHPDLRYRLLGLEAINQDKHADAFKFSQRAGFYADKPSQGMVAGMLRNG